MIRSVYSVSAVIIFFLTSCPCTDAFTTPASLSCRSGTIAVASLNVPRRSPPFDLRMIFGPPKDDGKPGDYLCKDCGYVFTKGPEAWAKLPDNYKCPPCGAPKFRFKKVPKGSEDGKKVEVKKSWF
jgi:rubredoxin